jgi:hypothetical protein
MSKKTFAAAPKPKQPTVEEIEAFEKEGVGHDRRPNVAAGTPAIATPSQGTKRLSLDLPENVHRRFKTACSATGRKMVTELQDFIARRITELEIEAGITRK